jgi:hypothetical protein
MEAPVAPEPFAAVAELVDRAAAISRAHPAGATLEWRLQRRPVSSERWVDGCTAVESAAMSRLGERSLALSDEHMEASRALVASRDPLRAGARDEVSPRQEADGAPR